MRHIVLDTETTGLNAEGDDRIIEIGAIELINFVPTGKIYHQYINPQRAVSAGAAAVHGITDDKLIDKPVYAEIVAAFEEFIGDSQMVIHNADFDMRFLNAEFRRLGMPTWPSSRAIDTLKIARTKFPGSPASLDALCKRFNVDLSVRTVHGALLDAGLLAEVFLHLSGGHQPELLGGGKNTQSQTQTADAIVQTKMWPAREFPVPADELAAHADMLGTIKESLWLKDKQA